MKTQPTSLTRRDALKTLGASAAFLGLNLFSNKLSADTGPGVPPSSNPKSAIQNPQSTYPFALPPLGYAYNALEPHIDALTMEIHHTKHHQAYITNANKALEAPAAAVLQKLSLDDMLAQLESADEPLRTTLRNNIGGHANHTFFWQIIAPQTDLKAPATPAENILRDAIENTFGSFDAFKTQFTDAATKRFGSGWAWLVFSRTTGKLKITSSANQDSPLLTNDVPVLGIDVWEHAYYLKYQNRRPDYIAAFWNVVNWTRVAANYKAVVA